MDRDGKLTIANAGHLAPYLDGHELAVHGGMPLGLEATRSYAESHFMLCADEQLTMLTDGVVEARNRQGELYGFERTSEIATLAADAIANKAREFGQEDDITVLTLSRISAAETREPELTPEVLSPSPA